MASNCLDQNCRSERNPRIRVDKTQMAVYGSTTYAQVVAIAPTSLGRAVVITVEYDTTG